MKVDQRHTKAPSLFKAIIKLILLLAITTALISTYVPSKSKRPYPSKQEFVSEVEHLVFSEEQIPRFTNEEKKLAQFGKKLFFDQRFSANNQVSCSHCHKPEKSFSDGLTKGEGIGKTDRRTPSIINSFYSHWFFWDGRADSLAAQALGPIEHPHEHGISRTHVVRKLKEFYLEEFEHHFGPWPDSLNEDLPSEASPRNNNVSLSSRISMYTLASINSFSVQDKILRLSQKKEISPAKLISQLADFTPSTPVTWSNSWNSLRQEQRNDINKVFSCFGKAIAQYEKGILAVNSPFDTFAKNFLAGNSEKESLVPGFGEEELEGLKIFIGPGQCTTCHMGPNFSDQQFHNIGLPISAKDILEDAKHYIDVGRSVGVIMAVNNSFNCKGRFDMGSLESESCLELPWLSIENLELVGAFKTPSLRNVSDRAPYTHDGRFTKLREVLNHYNKLPEDAGLGHMEETLQPLGLDSDKLEKLEAFLISISSPVVDLSTDRIALQSQKTKS